MLRACFIALILLFAVARPATSAPFTIDAWDLTTGIIAPNDSDGRFFFTVQNPFEDAHSLTMPAWSSASAAAYDFVWTELIGSFAIESSQEAFDVDSGTLFAVSTGRIWVTTTEDLELHVTGSYDYDLPAFDFFALFEFGVASVLDAGDTADSFDGHAVGTLGFENTVILPADATYQIQYQFRIQSLAGGTGEIGTGDGFIEFTLNAVPEPATLFLLPWAALALHGARSRRSKRR